MKAKLSSNLEENLKLNENENDIKWFLATDNMYSKKKKKNFKKYNKIFLFNWRDTRKLAKRRYGNKVVFYDVPISRADQSG